MARGRHRRSSTASSIPARPTPSRGAAPPVIRTAARTRAPLCTPTRWLALGLDDGALRWFDQVTPHDVRDHDFQNPPIVSGDLVIGSGKGGRVIAWDRTSHRRRWEAAVGLHRHDSGPLPSGAVSVCPGLLGGVETPAAAASGRVFVATVDLCYRENATGGAASSFATTDPARGRGVVTALDLHTGKHLWSTPLSSPPFGCTTVANDVVFVPTFDGRVRALAAGDGHVVWQTRTRAGINACPAVAGDTLYVASGTRVSSGGPPHFELTAYRLS